MTCDLRGYIIDCSESYPGSYNDRRVFNHYTWWTQPSQRHRTLAPGEYVIGDLGYKGDSTCVHTTMSFDKYLQRLGFPAWARAYGCGGYS